MKITPVLLSSLALSLAESTSNLPGLLQNISSTVFSQLRDTSRDIWENPELGLLEFHAHDVTIEYFQALDVWEVTPHAFGMATAVAAEFENRPDGFNGDIPTVGFIGEFDALPGVGHACGHNLLWLNAVLASRLAAEALVELGIPGKILLRITPDEENGAGKNTVEQHAGFDDANIWLMAHPAPANAFAPGNVRLNLFSSFKRDTHYDAVKATYQGMLSVHDLADLPGTASSVALIEEVSDWAVNVIQQQIGLGISGTTVDTVHKTVSSILDATYPNVTYTVENGVDGVDLMLHGPGGHASANSNGPLVLSIEVFRRLSGDSSLSFYLPQNTTQKELGFVSDIRTRYDTDINAIAKVVSDAIDGADSITSDIIYPEFEVDPYLASFMTELLATDAYGSSNFVTTDSALAATDASLVQQPEIDPNTKRLLSVAKVVLQPLFNICENPTTCGTNHEPLFAQFTGTDFAFNKTEIMGRAQAHTAVLLLTDPEMMTAATALIRSKGVITN
ncbi:hypothetical protein A0O28_0106510 [Trichoderma guizhouense]|uniref:Peptidase M20 domain-containing protein 2 n=1 Tax=Trichoderma guizhouense TaxID=1491466 RepID=A0A1T3CQU4_9HYPO|nr:hypothetical protein A0O28_0106510 [Trichoderma guizhouense]